MFKHNYSYFLAHYTQTKITHLLPYNRLVNETRAITLVQAGTQANQFASVIDCAGNITNFTENHAGKSFFFSEDSKETCPLIFVSVIRKVKSWIEQNILLLLFICKIHVIFTYLFYLFILLFLKTKRFLQVILKVINRLFIP